MEDFANYCIEGSKEELETPKLIKFGKTRVSNYVSFWLDYTTSYDKYYSKNYSIKKGDLIISLSFYSAKKEWNYYSPIWFRFKEQMKLN